MRSESIAALAAALAKAQGMMSGAHKSAENPYFKSKYADLASVWDACREPLSSNGLAVVQITDDAIDHGRVTVETILMHSSGEWVSGRIAMKPKVDDPQGFGSAITYARRYGLQAIVGIAPDDDDGNAASGNNGHRQEKPAVSFKKPISAPVNKCECCNGSGREKYGDFMRECYVCKGSGIQPPANSGQDGKSLQKEPPSQGAEAVEGEAVASTPSAVEIPGADCITLGQAKNFHIEFRKALKKEFQPNADALCTEWLRHQKILDVLGKPSALAIKQDSFFDVRDEAMRYAKSL